VLSKPERVQSRNRMDESKHSTALNGALENERRAYPRIREKFPVEISSNGTTYRGLTCDISEDGLSCRTDMPVPDSGQVEIDMFLPDREGEKLVCKARTVRKDSISGKPEENDNLTAFNFSEMSDEDRKILKDFIDTKRAEGKLNSLDIIPERADIFSNGISCLSDTYIPPFREVEINVFLPESGTASPADTAIKGSGVVVKSEKEEEGERYNVQLYFTDIADSDRQLLQEYINNTPGAEGL